MICDDKNPHGALEFAAANWDVDDTDGGAVVSVQRLGGAGKTVKVLYATSDGSAVSGTDYVATSGTLVFKRGVRTASFEVPLIPGALGFVPRAFNVALSVPTDRATIAAQNVATITMYDSRGPGVFEFTNANVAVLESSGSAVLDVSRLGDDAEAASVGSRPPTERRSAGRLHGNLGNAGVCSRSTECDRRRSRSSRWPQEGRRNVYRHTFCAVDRVRFGNAAVMHGHDNGSVDDVARVP